MASSWPPAGRCTTSIWHSPAEVPEEAGQAGKSAYRYTARGRGGLPSYPVYLEEVGRTRHAGIVGAYDTRRSSAASPRLRPGSR